MTEQTITGTITSTITSVGHRIGSSAPRPDGTPKVKGEFQFSSDLWEIGRAHV